MFDKKLSKSLVLYVLNPTTPTYQCEVCCYFKDGKCSQFQKGHDTVSPKASCNLWDHGSYILGPKNRLPGSSGYIENKAGFSCGRCQYYVSDTHLCKAVDEKGEPAKNTISPLGCCNRWEKAVTPRGDMPERELRSMPNFSK